MGRLTSDSNHIELQKSFFVAANTLVKNLGKEMTASKKVNTGRMVRSLEAKVVFTPLSAEINVLAAFYAGFVDRGRLRGARRVPIKPLLKWLKQRGFSSGSSKSDRSIAFAIQTKIFKEGIKPANFVDRALIVTGSSIENTLAIGLVREVERGFINIHKAAF